MQLKKPSALPRPAALAQRKTRQVVPARQEKSIRSINQSIAARLYMLTDVPGPKLREENEIDLASKQNLTAD